MTRKPKVSSRHGRIQTEVCLALETSKIPTLVYPCDVGVSHDKYHLRREKTCESVNGPSLCGACVDPDPLIVRLWEGHLERGHSALGGLDFIDYATSALFSRETLHMHLVPHEAGKLGIR